MSNLVSNLDYKGGFRGKPIVVKGILTEWAGKSELTRYKRLSTIAVRSGFFARSSTRRGISSHATNSSIVHFPWRKDDDLCRPGCCHSRFAVCRFSHPPDFVGIEGVRQNE